MEVEPGREGEGLGVPSFGNMTVIHTSITSVCVLMSGPFGHAAALEGHTGQNEAGGILFSVTQPLLLFCFLHVEPCPLCPLLKLY